MSDIPERVRAIRTYLTDNNLAALILPRSDEYLGEYVPVHNERLLWLTGFTGSAGQAIVCAGKAAIFVDGRYTEQVQEQTPNPPFEYCHLLENPPLEWLLEHCEAGDRVGADPRLHPYTAYTGLQAGLAAADIELIAIDEHPVDQLWSDRPRPETQQALLLPASITGESSLNKRKQLGAEVAAKGADTALVFQLDAIAWLLNIRGADVPHLPVILGGALIHSNGDMEFYTDPAKLPNDFSAHVGDGVEVVNESQFAERLRAFEPGQSVMVDESLSNAASLLNLQRSGATLVSGTDLVLLKKSRKNPVELAGIRSCHVTDGVAVSRFLLWIESEVAAGRYHNEATLSDKLRDIRMNGDDVHDLSFSTISAAGANAAMPHYNHMNGEPAYVADQTLYLVDSGGQYTTGTTDITRTVSCGEPTAEHRDRFTRVLKGHIALAQARFPKGTTGVQLDVLARMPLWQQGLDYDHGTGHGVGFFLSVHEGPQRIAKTPVKDGQLMPGMVLSNEPGYYKAGDYGIRCENLMAVVEASDGFLEFETLTFAPFDRRLIDTGLLSNEEKRWLNQYHEQVFTKLSVHMATDEQAWLRAATSSL